MQLFKIFKLSSVFCSLVFCSQIHAQDATFQASDLRSLTESAESNFHKKLIQYHYENGNTATALGIFKKEVLPSDQYTPSDINFGIELAKLEENLSDQVNIATKGVQKFGWNADWYYTIGNAYYEQENLKSATSFLIDVYRTEHNHLPTLIRLGDIANKKEAYSDAVQYYGKAFEQIPENNRIKRSYAIALSKTGKLKEAIGFLNEIKVENPEDVTTLYYLATIYKNSGNLSEACKQMQLAVQISDGKYGKAELRKWGCR